ncbi:MAG: iron chelate uptake ABC transporter family permease subunit, partial [Bacteroidales bacterium]|nr:iron chelate uptake ABC transporter family permease subunit [Bacteroidales bacterium]
MRLSCGFSFGFVIFDSPNTELTASTCTKSRSIPSSAFRRRTCIRLSSKDTPSPARKDLARTGALSTAEAWHALTGAAISSSAHLIVWGVRLPRVLAACACGVSLAVSGT